MANDQFEILDTSGTRKESLLELQAKCLRQQERARKHLRPGAGLTAYGQRSEDGSVTLTLLDRYGVAIQYVVASDLDRDGLAAVIARHSALSSGITRRN